MDLLVIPIQSISDVITNSSSELFILNTNDTEERVKEILANITYGYQEPFRFNLEEYLKVKDREYDYGTYYGSVKDNFFDLNDPIDRARCILWQSYYGHWYVKDGFVKRFQNFLDSNNLTDNPWDIEELGYLPMCSEWFANQEIPEWALPKDKSLQWLDGKILVLSDNDNSIPFDTFDLIENLFNAERMHLG